MPVTDLPAHAKDRLPEAAARAGGQAADITLELVKIYGPSPRVRSIVNDTKGKPPLDLTEIEKSSVDLRLRRRTISRPAWRRGLYRVRGPIPSCPALPDFAGYGAQMKLILPPRMRVRHDIVITGRGNHLSGDEANASESLCDALAALRLRVSSILHDEVGPSLCAAGLHLEALSQSPLNEDAREAAAGLRAALDAALERVRALMVENDARLLARSGLDRALTELARVLPLDWQEPQASLPEPPAADVHYGIARDCAVVCASASRSVRPIIRRTAEQMRITVPNGSGATETLLDPWLPAWQHLAGRAGIQLTRGRTGAGLEINLAPGPRAG